MKTIDKTILSNSGLSLIELMIAIAIGSILLLTLVTTFKSSSDSHRELQKSSDLIENGRYALDVLYNDVRHTGYYGYFSSGVAFPASLPDPCETADTAVLLSSLIVHIQGYENVTNTSLNATTCDDKGFFTTADLQDTDNDILVIRRADTELFAGTEPDATTLVTNGSTEKGEVYIQGNTSSALVQIAPTDSIDVEPLDTSSGKTADNVLATIQKQPTKTVNTWADTRKLHTHIYYVSQCSDPAVCTAAGTPTLKRLELGAADQNAIDEGRCSSGATCMNIVPLVEGVEKFKVEYGVDNSPTTTDSTTGHIGDGIPDTYTSSPSTADFQNVVTVRISLLVRTLNPTVGFTDSKTYSVGSLSVTKSDSYKRNVYKTEIRLNNIAGSREIP